VGEMSKACRFFNLKAERKRLLGKPLLILKFGIKEIRCGCVDWIHLNQDRDQWRVLVNTVINLRVP
jgi:hypothetical protein